MERKFKVGDRVQRDDGNAGTVTNTDFYHVKGQPYWVRVKWDRTGSKSDRVEDGLTLIEDTEAAHVR